MVPRVVYIKRVREEAEARAKRTEKHFEDMAANDTEKLAELRKVANTMDRIAASLHDKRVPSSTALPALSVWLAEHDLTEYEVPLSEWGMDLLMQMAHDQTVKEWDEDLSESVPPLPKRRKLKHALCEAFAKYAA